jgi:hypothetical protein
MIVADAHRRRGVAKVEDLDPTSSRAVAEYLSVLDDAAFGGASPSEPKAISPADPAARYTAAANSAVMDVEATTAIRQAEVALFSQLGHSQDRRCGSPGCPAWPSHQVSSSRRQ